MYKLHFCQIHVNKKNGKACYNFSLVYFHERTLLHKQFVPENNNNNTNITGKFTRCKQIYYIVYKKKQKKNSSVICEVRQSKRLKLT